MKFTNLLVVECVMCVNDAIWIWWLRMLLPRFWIVRSKWNWRLVCWKAWHHIVTFASNIIL